MEDLVDLRVRTASVDDLPVLRTIYRRSSLSNPEDAVALLAHPDLLELGDDGVRSGRTRVAVTDEVAVVGFATVAPGGGGALELDALFVDPDVVRRGVGRLLVADVVDRARWAGVARVEVTSGARAQAFYERLGFTVVGEVPTLLGTAVRLHLDVAAAG